MQKIKSIVLLFILINLKIFAQGYSIPVQSPFSHNVGINFNLKMTNWYDNPAIKYDAAKRNKCATDRLVQVIKTFKMVRIYNFLIPGFESTGTTDCEATALINVLQNNDDVEAVIGTSMNKTFFLSQDNTDFWVKVLSDSLDDNIKQVKCILIGNEVNSGNPEWTADDVKKILGNFTSSLDDANLNIPVTFSVSSLPDQPGDNYSDALVDVIASNWDSDWNNGYPFIFIDPYPDAPGINSPAGVYAWQQKVTEYYQKKYPKLQIFIGETGGEGYGTDAALIPVINGIFSQLDAQYKAHNKTVPTFIFEAVDEPLKPASPDQRNMGIYKDSEDPFSGSSIILKNGIVVPAWIK